MRVRPVHDVFEQTSDMFARSNSSLVQKRTLHVVLMRYIM